MSNHEQGVRMIEALLFAAAEPLDEGTLASRVPEGTDVVAALASLRENYSRRGVTLVKVAGGWSFRTAPDLAFLLQRERTVARKLSRAGVETLAIIAYHQPITRAEIEEVRGVGLSKGTVDTLMQAGWVRIRGRKRTPGRPVTYGTTQKFLDHFGLEDVADLPGIDELKAAGLLTPEPPAELFQDVENAKAFDVDEDQGEGPGTDSSGTSSEHSLASDRVEVSRPESFEGEITGVHRDGTDDPPEHAGAENSSVTPVALVASEQ